LHAVTAYDKVFAAKGCYATVVSYAGQAIGSSSFKKNSASKTRAGFAYATYLRFVRYGAGEWLDKMVSTRRKTAGNATANINYVNYSCRASAWGDLGNSPLATMVVATQSKDRLCMSSAFLVLIPVPLHTAYVVLCPLLCLHCSMIASWLLLLFHTCRNVSTRCGHDTMLMPRYALQCPHCTGSHELMEYATYGNVVDRCLKCKGCSQFNASAIHSCLNHTKAWSLTATQAWYTEARQL